ncbi:helix-turn-helix domain-containing protein [Methylobacterium ajmalii]|uniref:helix-turn-helix domain-containing protein n=1 Tax=Methylobacterium ajmalii TaxID=2738439 RepID=UPI002E365CC2|nr:helix-turn-helix domain-containing protein [Methylobacterium ajmalii]
MPAALSVDRDHRFFAALGQGLSCPQAADRFGVSPANASRWRARLSTHGVDRLRTGTPRPGEHEACDANLENVVKVESRAAPIRSIFFI